MKIVELRAENVKRLRAVLIRPTGPVVQLTGANEQGKSSVLDCIWWALEGAKHIQAVPIRKGATRARIRLDLGELVVERRFSAAGTTLVVENAEGARYKAPQEMLDALVGALTMDPLAFARAEPKKQYELLRDLVPLKIDVDELDRLNAANYEKRKDLNRQAKQALASAESMKGMAPDGVAAVDETGLLAELTAASGQNADLERRRANRATLVGEIGNMRAKAARLSAQAEELRAQADNLEAQAHSVLDSAAAEEKRLQEAPSLPEPVDADALRARYEEARRTNAAVQVRENYLRFVRQAAELEEKAEALTANITAREEEKRAAIAAAPMPVPGLSFGDGSINFDGVPFEQASTSTKLRVGVAVAMASNPKVRVLRVEEGSALDAANLALLGELAAAHDFQVWVERVDDSGKVGVTIVDGEVAAVDGVSREKISEPETVPPAVSGTTKEKTDG